MKNITIGLERNDGRFWTYIQRSAGELPNTPLFKVLNWVLEQLNFGYVESERDERGDVVSLTLGKGTVTSESTIEEVRQDTESRLLGVNIAGILAQGRESGIPPDFAERSKQVSRGITEWGERNTEFHYAFELIKVLARLNKKTFRLEAPPILGLAPASVVSYLRESTRCWLYGFHGASVALSRACLEDTLRNALSVVPGVSLESLIEEASRCGLLDECMVKIAHTIRKVGNKFLHGQNTSEADSREALDGVRSIVEQVFPS